MAREILREVWILDPAGRGWREGPALPGADGGFLGAAAVGDEIHAVWESTYQIFDAGSGVWSRGPTGVRRALPDVLRRRRVVHGGRLYDGSAIARSSSAAASRAARRKVWLALAGRRPNLLCRG